jgi:DNA-binding response OmpR family regulator
LPRVLIVANESESITKLKTDLAQRGLDCFIVPENNGPVAKIVGQHPAVVLLDADDAKFGSEAWELAQKMRQDMHVPLIALIAREKLNGFDLSNGIDDFVVKPCEATEVTSRIKRILTQKGGEENDDVVRCGDLVIDSIKCEVSLCGKPIMLTFKEYQLLRFLADNRGKVFTRDVLLDRVWGWDYYGGDRTVDVHIRRLRSKIEDSTHAFIETVRNIGYKFKVL